MTDKNGTTTTTTMWQDPNSGLRRHKLMTKELADTIPALYTNENVEDYDTVLAPAKLFSPYSNWTWYITEMDAAIGLCFGLVQGFEDRVGLLRPHRVGGGQGVRTGARSGARPLLEAADPGRDKEAVEPRGVARRPAHASAHTYRERRRPCQTRPELR